MIRRAQTSDLNHLANLFETSIFGIGPAHYSTLQVSVWAARAGHMADRIAETFSERAAWVDWDPLEGLRGYIDLERDGHLDMFYVHPESARSDLSRDLYLSLENHAQSVGLKRIYAEASEAALRFFSKHGFKSLHRRELDIEGIAIHNYAVEKLLHSNE